MNRETVIRLIGKGEVEKDVLNTLDWDKPLDFQGTYEKISPSTQTAEATYLTGGTLLEFDVIVSTGQYVRPANEIKFYREGGHYLETITISRKDDLKTIVHPRLSGSIAVYMRSLMEDMSADQLKIIERDVLFYFLFLLFTLF